LKSSDPRPSLEERYSNHDGYVAAVKAAAEAQVREGYMRPEDVAGAVGIARASKVLQ